VKSTVLALVAFVLALFMLLTGVLVVVPAERASAAMPLNLGPDGYFSGLIDYDGDGQLLPVIDEDSRTSTAGDGMKNVSTILFGKQGSSGTYGSVYVSSGYRTLAVGEVPSVPAANSFQEYGNQDWLKSATTSVNAHEALLWATDHVTSGIEFSATSNSFDSNTGNYKSTLALVSDIVGSTYYSPFEQGLLRSAKLEGVCTAGGSAGCGGGSFTQQTLSANDYVAFPLTVGDLNKFTGFRNGWGTPSYSCNLSVPATSCSSAGSTGGYWLRSPRWDTAKKAFNVWQSGSPTAIWADNYQSLRPAVRLTLKNLLLTAHSANQSQPADNQASLRLTYVESGKTLSLTSRPYIEKESNGDWVLKDLAGTSDLTTQSGLGWKLFDPDNDAKVLASGRTNYDAAAGAAGNMKMPCSTLTPQKDYRLYMWGQQDGSNTTGWTNHATEPLLALVRANGDGACELNIPKTYGISLTGQTSGTLTAYRIGEYGETLFTQTGALKSVRLSTPAGLGTVLMAAAVAAGGSDVDVENPIGWVGSRWLGYPTDPASEDVTSAFSPYAGRLQLFAKALADAVTADGDAVLGGVQGSLNGLDAPVGNPVTLPVSGPGLYLIVDSTQSSGGSLPIIVGTKVFNDAVGDDVVEDGMVDFADAGVNGKPRLGQSALKTTVTDVAKFVVNDPGLDGFDVGSEVEYEIALRVPDLNGFSVPYDAYEFSVEDTAGSGLTLPAASGVKVLLDTSSRVR
jgi:hypothetical protein